MTRASKSRPKAARAPANSALFGTHDNPRFLLDAISITLNVGRAVVVSEDGGFLPVVPVSQRLGFADAALDGAPIEQEVVIAKLVGRVEPLRDPTQRPRAVRSASGLARARPDLRAVSGLVVDMRWAIPNMEAVTSLERWGAVAERLSAEWGKPVISVYDQDTVIEEQMQTALRVHSQFLAPSGLHTNPYWISSALLETASLDEQLAFMLARVVPDYEGLHRRRKGGEMFARGATPSWLAKPSMALGASSASARWHVHCFGQLKVFIGGRSIDWRIAGGTPRKTRTLFAYLLSSGEKGARAEQISELLWPEEESEDIKRARLHHTVAMLRKTLGHAGSVLRAGDYYRLNAPSGSWIDIDTFEQLCRRGLSLFKKGDHEAALVPYLAAHQLYAGDLFEDLPREYTESEQENWCLPRRIWLREMAAKLQTDLTRVLVKSGRTREALEHCMKALAIDPASDGANAEAMRIFEAQGRTEAIHRQYRQYKQAVAAVGAAESAELKGLFQALTIEKSTTSSRSTS